MYNCAGTNLLYTGLKDYIKNKHVRFCYMQ